MNRRNRNTARDIAAWIARVRPRDIPADVRGRAKEHLLDGFAVMLAGADEPASRHIDDYIADIAGPSEATIIGARLRAPAEYAALANGVRGHVLDYDDAQLATRADRPFGQLVHPTTPVLAAAAAVAEKLHASGAALLAAYVTGVEVACRLADAVDPAHYLNGFHPTGTFGTFGATAACAHMLGLDASKTLAALGVAGSLAAGVRAHRGTMAKSLNAGRAAQNGVAAANLARKGFTASTDIFDDPMGYFRAACPGPLDRKLIRMGPPFFFSRPGIAIKFYPCAGVLHPALDALIETVERNDIRPDQIESVQVRLGKDAALPLVYDRPRNALEGKFSLPFSAALAVVYRRAALSDYSDDQIRNPQNLATMKRVTLIRAAELKSAGNLGAQAEIEIVTRDGQRHRAEAKIAKGHPAKPLSDFELKQKFEQAASRRIPQARAARFMTELERLEKQSSVAAMLRLLQPGR